MIRVLTVFEALLKAAVNLLLAFVFTTLFQIDESLRHLFTHLLWGLKVCHELLFIDAVFAIEKGFKSNWISENKNIT